MANSELFDMMLETVQNIKNPDDNEPVKDERAVRREQAVREVWPFDL